MHHAYSGYYAYLQVELQCNNPHFEKLFVVEKRMQAFHRGGTVFRNENCSNGHFRKYTCQYPGCFLLMRSEERAQGPLVGGW